ncbi:MAG: hypothetical protein QXD05_00050 [Candidatus Pacearchaeota archaeon]
MKVKTVSYSKLFNLGNFEHEKIGCEVELEENENPIDVLSKAKAFVELSSKDADDKIERAKRIIADELNYKLREVNEAKKIIKALEELELMGILLTKK